MGSQSQTRLSDWTELNWRHVQLVAAILDSADHHGKFFWQCWVSWRAARMAFIRDSGRQKQVWLHNRPVWRVQGSEKHMVHNGKNANSPSIHSFIHSHIHLFHKNRVPPSGRAGVAVAHQRWQRGRSGKSSRVRNVVRRVNVQKASQKGQCWAESWRITELATWRSWKKRPKGDPAWAETQKHHTAWPHHFIPDYWRSGHAGEGRRDQGKRRARERELGKRTVQTWSTGGRGGWEGSRKKVGVLGGADWQGPSLSWVKYPLELLPSHTHVCTSWPCCLQQQSKARDLEEDSLPEGRGRSAEPHTVCPLEGLRGSQGEQEGMVSSPRKGEGRAFPDVCPALCFVLTSHIFLSWPRPSGHYYCPLFMEEGFTCGSAGKDSTCNAGDLGLIPGSGRSSGEGKDYPLQYSDLENSMDLHSPWGCKDLDTIERLNWKLLSPGAGDGKGSLACCSPWGCKQMDMTEQLNWTELYGGSNWSFWGCSPGPEITQHGRHRWLNMGSSYLVIWGRRQEEEATLPWGHFFQGACCIHKAVLGSRRKAKFKRKSSCDIKTTALGASLVAHW